MQRELEGGKNSGREGYFLSYGLALLAVCMYACVPAVCVYVSSTHSANFCI